MKRSPEDVYESLVRNGKRNGMRRWEGVPKETVREMMFKPQYYSVKKRSEERAFFLLCAKVGSEDKARSLITQWERHGGHP